MRSCLKQIPAIFLIAGVVQAQEAGKAPEPAKAAATAAAPAAAKADKGKDRLDFPVPKGQPQKGLRIPIFTPLGKMTMDFQIGVATWIDDDNVSMGDLKVETYNDKGDREFHIDLPASVFNIRTKELTSKAHVTVARNDFEISGNSMIFNTETKVGKFGDGVKMVIYDARVASAAKSGNDAKPSVKIEPTEEKK